MATSPLSHGSDSDSESESVPRTSGGLLTDQQLKELAGIPSTSGSFTPYRQKKEAEKFVIKIERDDDGQAVDYGNFSKDREHIVKKYFNAGQTSKGTKVTGKTFATTTTTTMKMKGKGKNKAIGKKKQVFEIPKFPMKRGRGRPRKYVSEEEAKAMKAQYGGKAKMGRRGGERVARGGGKFVVTDKTEADGDNYEILEQTIAPTKGGETVFVMCKPKIPVTYHPC